MNLIKALKHKKKLIKQADEFYKRFSEYNSHESITMPSYDPQEMYDSWLTTTDELIALKAKIHRANTPIADKIFKIGEIKNLITRLRVVDTKEGKFRNRYSDEAPIEYVSYIGLVAKDNQIKIWEVELDQLQEDIEAFNAITKI